jgi:hypothetical protein
MAEKRSYASGKFTLELDGYSAGFLKSVEGGGIKTDLISEPVGPHHVVFKHIGPAKYEDFTISVGLGTSAPLQQWIQDSWNHAYTRKNGSVIQADFDLREKFRRDFFHALVSEIGFPALDGSDKKPGYLTVKFSPETIHNRKGDGSLIKGVLGGQQKAWSHSNFEFLLDGMETSRVSKVDAFAVKQTAVEEGVPGGDAKEPGKLEFPNLSLYCSEEFIDPWTSWHEDFVIRGNCTQDREKTGAIKFLGPNVDKSKPLLTIDLRGVGIMGCTPEKMEANADTIKRWKIDLYVEDMAFSYESSAQVK